MRRAPPPTPRARRSASTANITGKTSGSVGKRGRRSEAGPEVRRSGSPEVHRASRSPASDNRFAFRLPDLRTSGLPDGCPMKILCVCTGNTCRSPMLATLLRGLVAQRGIEGVQVESAGTGAGDGEPATPQAVSTMAGFGLDLRGHRSRHVGGVDLGGVDRVLCMTSSHAAYIRSLGVPAARIQVVNADHGGVPDPFGGTLADYELCARTLERFAVDLLLALAPAPPAMTSMPTPDLIERARAGLDAAHAAEPAPPAGKPSELAYAGHIEQWIGRLVEQPSLA